MLQRFRNYIIENSLLAGQEKLLVAVSGGVDSVVVTRLLKDSGFVFAIAHCNFGLRGNESDGDEQFVEQLAKNMDVPFFVKRFDTIKHLSESKISVQMSARELRYNWFHELLSQNGYDLIVTAHHANDALESVLLNFVRGTGIAGFHGIQPKIANLLRPLLFASKAEILAFAHTHHLLYREDSSNKSEKYKRNLIRNKVVPLLESINPNLVRTNQVTASKIKAAEMVLKEQVSEFKEKAFVSKNDKVYISIKNISSTPGGSFLLYESISGFGFSWEDISSLMKILDEAPGKIFLSKNYMLVKDRTHLVIACRKEKDKVNIYFGEDEKIVKASAILLKQSIIDCVTPGKDAASSVAYLDFEKLSFPLLLRNWEPGDRFLPLGMKGSKKVSDFLIDKKISIDEKSNIMVLISGTSIVWLVNHRIDERFKVTFSTKKILRLEVESYPPC